MTAAHGLDVRGQQLVKHRRQAAADVLLPPLVAREDVEVVERIHGVRSTLSPRPRATMVIRARTCAERSRGVLLITARSSAATLKAIDEQGGAP